MKSMLTTLFLLCCLAAVAQEKNTFSISGKVTDADSGILFIRNLNKMSMDTLKVMKGKFSFAGEVSEATPFVLADEYNHYQLFFVDPGTRISISLSLADFKITAIKAGPSQDIYQKLIRSQESTQKAMEDVQKLMNTPGYDRDSLQKETVAINNKRNENFYSFIREEGNSEVAAFVVYSSISNDRSGGIDATLADSMFNFLKGNARTGFYGKEVEKTARRLRAVSVGFIAPDFTLPDSSGQKNYTLSSFRGKYTLLDFWASWCGPCKSEIPFMKTAYEHFHNKGFEIFSVSIDENPYNWKNALQYYQMPWVHVIDFPKQASVINPLYPLPTIPKTLLLDKEGKIIATDLRGTALDQKLEQLLGK